MPALTPQDFVSKWKRAEARERQSVQQHFIDLCALGGHETPRQQGPLARASRLKWVRQREPPNACKQINKWYNLEKDATAFYSDIRLTGAHDYFKNALSAIPA